MTYNCNHACKFCSCPWLRHSRLYERELSIDEWKRIINNLADWGIDSLSFTGGEPLLKTGLQDLITTTAESRRFKFISLFTNGTLLDDNWFDLLRRYQIPITISLPGIFSFKSLTSSPITSRKVMENVTSARHLGIEVNVSIVVTKKNYWEVPLCAYISYRYGASAIQIGPCMPEGRALYHSDLCLSDRQFKRLTNTVNKLNYALKIPVFYSFEQACACFDRNGNSIPNGTTDCQAGKTFFAIGPAGGIRKCLHAPVNMGNILDCDQHTFENLWKM
jgi:MoaA/NifB/PqqE/SkfB family radical SAM enzyme